ncbi:MAG: right-handed parallel beta-helix repeat-containing protein [Lentisphaeria bacterium]
MRRASAIAACLAAFAAAALAGCEPQPKTYPVALKGGRGQAVHSITARDGNTFALVASGGDGLTIRGCTFSNFGLGALDLIQESNVLIEDCTFTGCDRLAPLSGNGQWVTGKVISLWGCRNVVIRNCTFRDQRGGRCVVFWGGTTDANITGCVMQGLGLGEPNRADDGAVYLNECFPGEPITERILIQGNRIDYPNGIGVYADGPGAGSALGSRFCERVTIKNNVIAADRGILLWAKNSAASGNDLSACRQPYGVVYAGGGNVIDGVKK